MSETLYRKYRPAKFEDVVGQRAAVKALKNLLDDGMAQTFLLQGPSGTGKTTLARIAAKHLGCSGLGLSEIPAAKYTGVDSMRELQDMAQYKPFGKSDIRAIVLDECQALSKNAWESILKATEEPPPHVYWFFCTTNPAKVPHTIKTRCSTISLKDVSNEELQRLVERVIAAERFKVSDGVVDLIVREAHGSPRQALVNLASCSKVTDRKDAASLLQTVLDSDATLELCRFLAASPRGSWVKAMSIVEKLKEENPEAIRISVANYFGVVAANAKSDKAACAVLGILDAFSTPFLVSDNRAPLIIAIGRAMFGQT